MNITLRLRYCCDAQRPPSAWLLPGNSPREWLEELASWKVPLVGATLRPLPHPDRPNELLGAVVGGLLERPKSSGIRAIPYGQVGEQILVPVEAALDPFQDEKLLIGTDNESEVLFIWHPTTGLFRIESKPISIAALIAAPRSGERNWNAAQPGVAVNQRLYSIEPTVRPTTEQVLNTGRDDIGSQSNLAGELPKAPGEPAGGAIGNSIAQAGLKGISSAAAAITAGAGMVAAGAGAVVAGGAALAGGLGGAAAALGAEAGGLAAGAAGLAGAVAGGLIGKAAASSQKTRNQPQSDSWLGRLAKWAKRRREAVEQRLEFLRNHQVERLLNLLKSSPDDGLRFALPVAPGNHRGVGQPGWRLVERDVGFNLKRLFGGEPIDPWNLPSTLQHRLREQYRELANREIALKRYHRAAYIFAELLGNLSAAAATLAEGGHFREAAVLYDERLHQPQAAAKCLERGGLLTEAISLYERIEQWEAAGDLYRKIEQSADAERSFRKATDLSLARKDYLDAARLLEFKIQAPDEAYAVLCEGWRGSPVAHKCLDASFDFLARHQRHDAAFSRVGELADDTLDDVTGQALAASLAKVAGDYPHATVRVAAADRTRGIVSQRMSVAGPRESQNLLASLASLAPADRLLTRDCERYYSSRDWQLNVQQARSQRRAAVRVVRSFRLPEAEWQAAVSVGDEFYAAGWLKQGLIIVRSRWKGSVQQPAAEPLWVPPESQGGSLLLASDPRGLSATYVHLAAKTLAVRPAEFRATDVFPVPVSLQPHPGCDQHTVLLQYSSGGVVLVGKLVLDEDERIALQITPYDGERILPSLPWLRLPLSAEVLGQTLIPFLARGDTLYVGYGPHLISMRGRQAIAEMPTPIHSLAGSPPHTRSRIVVGCEQGCVLVWGDTADAPQIPFATDLFQPAVGINRGGWVTAVTHDSVQIYGTHDGKLVLAGQIEGPNEQPIAVLSTDHAQRIAVVTAKGTVFIYEVSN